MKYNANFHETFPITFEYIAKILDISNNDREYTKEDISNITGIPTGVNSGKVVPHIEYAKFMNLIEYTKSNKLYVLKRTKLGEEIYTEDPHLTEEITYKIMNFFLTSVIVGAEMWSLFYRKLMRKYNNKLTEEILLRELIRKYGEKVKKGPLISSYEGNESKIKLLEFKENSIKKSRKSSSQDSIYAYGYCLLFDWEKKFNEVEITIDQLNEIYWKEGFNFNLEEEFKVLSILEEKGILKLNKQLSPMTIIKLKESEDLLKDIYSLLI